MGIEIFFNIFKDITGIILILFIILVPIYILERRDSYKLEKKRLSFTKKLKDGLVNEKINNISHIRKLYASIVNTNYFYLNKWTKDVLFDSDLKDKEIFNKLDNMINELEFQEPFSELPSVEREILSTLFNDKSNNKELFETKLHSLSNVLKYKYSKKEKSDKWVVRLTVVSTILTIISCINIFI